MKLPKMTAERAIGPALGSYALSAPSDQRAVLSPMAVSRARTTQDRLTRADQKHGDAASPCPDGTRACWGRDGTPQDLDYECCQTYEDCGIDPATGDPTCELRVTRQLFRQLGLPGQFGPVQDLEKYL